MKMQPVCESRTRSFSVVFTLFMVLVIGIVASPRNASAAVSEKEAYAIGFETYLYLYPLVIMDITRLQAVNVGAEGFVERAPMNAFAHADRFPPGDYRDVIRPNFDTLYSAAWLDLSEEPIIVSAPATGDHVYYMLPMLDMWTDVFANPGTRTTGNGAGHFALTPPGWGGDLPNGVVHIPSPTGIVWIIGRTQTNGPADYANVHAIQKGYRLTKLSEWGKEASPIAAMPVDVDMDTQATLQVDRMAASAFFERAVELLKNNPPHLTDVSIVARMARIGIVPGESFDFESADPIVQAALNRVAEDAPAAMRAAVTQSEMGPTNWMTVTQGIGVYGNDYFFRAAIARCCIGANPPEDAIYPQTFVDAEGNAFNPANKYFMRFEKGALPPVDAFWSVTLYDKEGFPVPNEINRLAIGDRDSLIYGADGSLEIYIQADSPGGSKAANWLPAPKQQGFSLTMRLYRPQPSALFRQWNPPKVQKIE